MGGFTLYGLQDKVMVMIAGLFISSCLPVQGVSTSTSSDCKLTKCTPYPRHTRQDKTRQGKARQGKAGQGKRRHRRNESPRNTTKPALDSSKAWSVETRPAPSRHSRDGRVYGHTTTAMHETSTPPFPSRQKTSSAANLQAAAQQRLETLQPVPVLYGEDL